MKSIAVAFVFLLSGLALAAQPIPAPSNTVRGDFDGDGIVDQATLVQYRRHVTLTVRRGSASGPEIFEFRVDPAAQDAICTLPARLITSPSFCTPMDEPLPGCMEQADKVDLLISDDACDAIHVYWDQNEKRMAWWRL